MQSLERVVSLVVEDGWMAGKQEGNEWKETTGVLYS